MEQNWGDADLVESWRNEAAQQVEETVAKVQREPNPDPYKEDWSALASEHLREMYSEA